MAIVPRFERQTTLRPVSGVQRRSAETPESQGAGLEQARADTLGASARFFEGASQMAAHEAAQIAEEERARADNTALLSGDNELATWEAGRMDQVQQTRGKDAAGLPEKVRDEFEKKAGEIEARLNERQRLAFAQVRARRGENLDLSVRRYTLGEMRQVEATEYKAGVDNNRNAAIANYDDHDRVGQELATGIARIKARSKLLGMGAEAEQNELDGFTQAVHVGVIKAYIANDRADQARAYFTAVKGDLGDAAPDLQTLVTKAGQRKTSQQKADEILAQGGTLTEQLDKAKGIDDPDVRDMVEDRLRQATSVKDREVRERDEDNTKLAFNILNKTNGNINQPGFALLLDSLPPGAQASVRSYADHVARGVDVTTDRELKYELLDTASTDPEAFATANLWTYHGSLSNSDFDELQRIQMAYRAKDAKAADAQLKGFRTKSELVDDTLTLYSIDVKDTKNAEVQRAVSTVRDMLDQRVEAAGGTANVTNEQMKSILDDILTRSAEVPGTLWGSTTKRLIDLTIKDVAPHRARIERVLTNAGRPVSDATVLSFDREVRMRLGDDLSASAIDRVPAQDRKDIETALKVKGKPVTPDAVVDLYLEILARMGVR